MAILFFSKIILALIMFLGFILAIWVYTSNRKSRINQTFFFFTVALLFWMFFGFLITLPDQQISRVILWTKLAYVGVFLWFVGIYFFLMYFPKEEKRSYFVDIIFLVSGLGLSLITLFTDLLIEGAITSEIGSAPILGKGLIPIYIVLVFLTLIILKIIVQKYIKLSQKEKLKIHYFSIGLLTLIIANLIFNIFISPRWGMIPYAYIANYSAIFFLGFTAYAIVKQELFGIRVILTQILVAAIAVLLLWQAVTASGWDLVWKFALFLIFLPFGYFLIQSVIREIKRRVELQRLNVELRRLYEQVDRLSKAKSEFLSMASHQLRTPQTVIKGYISMLIEGTYGLISEKIKNILEKVYQSNERLIGIVNDLLNVSRIESGTLALDLEKTSLDKMISSIIDEMIIKANEKKLYLKWEKPEKPLPEITVDPSKMRQVVLNIVDNCIKYTERGGVTVKTEQKGASDKYPQGSILIKIKDTGAGMTKEELEKMFESYSRGKAGASFWSAGLGLGLYIAKKFTEIHGGKIWAESEGEDKGSTFYIELPIK